MKNSANDRGKHSTVCGAQPCGVFWTIVAKSSLHHEPSAPVTWVARANVNTKARFNSSDSADTNVFGSARNLESSGWTSPLPSPTKIMENNHFSTEFKNYVNYQFISNNKKKAIHKVSIQKLFTFVYTKWM